MPAVKSPLFRDDRENRLWQGALAALLGVPLTHTVVVLAPIWIISTTLGAVAALIATGLFVELRSTGPAGYRRPLNFGEWISAMFLTAMAALCAFNAVWPMIHMPR